MNKPFAGVTEDADFLVRTSSASQFWRKGFLRASKSTRFKGAVGRVGIAKRWRSHGLFPPAAMNSFFDAFKQDGVVDDEQSSQNRHPTTTKTDDNLILAPGCQANLGVPQWFAVIPRRFLCRRFFGVSIRARGSRLYEGAT